jgi:putative transposase
VRLFKLIDAEKKADYSISLLCRVLQVSRSGYYDWKDRPPSKRDRENAALTPRITQIHERSRGTYGYPRVHAELQALGVRCSRKRVARLMRIAGIQGCLRGRKRRTTTRHDKHATPAPDLVGRNFTATSPDRLWTADITYVRTQEGFVYLSFVLDVYSRRVVGWSISDSLRTELVVNALEMALWRRKPSSGLVHHSDRGAQYTALSFGKRLEEAGVVASMGRTGSALDNAISESFVASLKTELLHEYSFRTRAAARRAIFDYIEAFYNRQRRHSSLGYLSPSNYEQATMEEVAVA